MLWPPILLPSQVYLIDWIHAAGDFIFELTTTKKLMNRKTAKNRKVGNRDC